MSLTARGNERRLIYRSEEDRRLFLETLEQMRIRFGVVLDCFCLIALQTTYTIRFNRKYCRSGHLFQGRYKAHLVEADEYAMELVRYLHLNPVRPRSRGFRQRRTPTGTSPSGTRELGIAARVDTRASHSEAATRKRVLDFVGAEKAHWRRREN